MEFSRRLKNKCPDVKESFEWSGFLEPLADHMDWLTGHSIPANVLENCRIENIKSACAIVAKDIKVWKVLWVF